MQVVVLTNESLKQELLDSVEPFQNEITWIENLSELKEHPKADVFIDLLFEKNHLIYLQNLSASLVIINSVEYTLAETNPSFVRINAWPSLLKSPIIEASSLEESKKEKTEEAFSLFNKKMEWLPDEPGFVTSRVISMIINEAFMALEENISTKQEINTAMKLGTNYPFGPFEWAERIGIEKIYSLLQVLSKESLRYHPSLLLASQKPL